MVEIFEKIHDVKRQSIDSIRKNSRKNGRRISTRGWRIFSDSTLSQTHTRECAPELSVSNKLKASRISDSCSAVMSDDFFFLPPTPAAAARGGDEGANLPAAGRMEACTDGEGTRIECAEGNEEERK